MGESILAVHRGRLPFARPARCGTVVAVVVVLAFVAGCSCDEEEQASPPSPVVGAPPPDARTLELPRLLYLPDGSATAPPSAPEQAVLPGPYGSRRCPPEMVAVGTRFCIDRFEARLVDMARGRPISPYYPPSRSLAVQLHDRWDRKRHTLGGPNAQMMPVPELPAWQRQEDFEPRAESERGVVPNGYLTADVAELACKNAGKRLCTEDEWVSACRGERNEPFPYGAEYVQGRCNVFREAHPAAELHDDMSIGHSDPRLNRVEVRGKPLLRATGVTETCASRWDDDAIYDMVGNLDEWVDDPDGVFRGGFFSRSSRDGCEKRVGAHPRHYFDYSLGVRCCL